MARTGTARRPSVEQIAAHARALAQAKRTEAAMWLMAFAPLIWLPGGFSRFLFPKVLLVVAAGALACLGVRRGSLPRTFWLLAAAGAGWFVVVSLAGGTPVASLVGRWPRYEGLPMLLLYAGCVALGARMIGTAREALDRFGEMLAWASLVLAGLSLLNLIGVSPLGNDHSTRDGSVLGNATDQGLVGLICVAVCGAAWLTHRTWLALAGTIAGIAVVVASASRASLGLMVICLLVLAWSARREYASRRVLLGAGGALVLVALAVLAVPVARDRLLSLVTVNGRGLQWELTLKLIGDHPLGGVGPSRYVDAFGAYESRDWVKWTSTGVYPDSPHNMVLQLLVAGGIPMLLLGLALVVWAVRRMAAAVRADGARLGLMLAAVAYAAAMLVNFTNPTSTCLAVFVAGALLAVEPRREPRWAPPALAALFGVAALMLALGCISELQLEKGVQAVARGDLAAATSAFDDAKALRPLDGDVPMLAAQSLAQGLNHGAIEDAPAAISYAQASLARTPTTYQALVSLAAGQIAENRLKDALATLDSAIADYPQRTSALVLRGITRSGLGDRAGALTDLREALRTSPKSVAARTALQKVESSAK